MSGTEKRKCYRCYEDKGPSEFPTKGSKLMGICAVCYRAHYGDPAAIEQKRRLKNKEIDKRRQKRCQDWSRQYLQAHACMDCGTDDWVVLEFDHREPSKKYKGVSLIITSGALSVLVEEVKKCDVVCANCHKHRTYKANGSW